MISLFISTCVHLCLLLPFATQYKALRSIPCVMKNPCPCYVFFSVSWTISWTARAGNWFNVCNHGLHVNITPNSLEKINGPKANPWGFQTWSSSLSNAANLTHRGVTKLPQNTGWSAVINRQLSAVIDRAIAQAKLKNPLITGEELVAAGSSRLRLAERNATICPKMRG